jgi:rhodanese-related sulfurtransferase
MIDNSDLPPRGCGCSVGGIAREAALVGVFGVAFAFLANQLSPLGLNPARNYFPGDSAPSTVPAPAPAPPQPSGGSNAAAPAPSPAEALAARLQANGLHLTNRAGAEQLFRDPRREQNLIIFVDARDDGRYQEGHIPGAFEFYPYYPEKYMEGVITPCALAEQIIVYCTGGDCEDSESAALFLRDACGVPAAKLFIYGGGMTEWEAAGLPVESGPRNSGDIRNHAP